MWCGVPGGMPGEGVRRCCIAWSAAAVAVSSARAGSRSAATIPSDDERPEVAIWCPVCAAAEFGYRPDGLAGAPMNLGAYASLRVCTSPTIVQPLDGARESYPDPDSENEGTRCRPSFGVVFSRLAVAGVAAAAVVAVVVPAAAAATFDVTNTNNSGPGSFRQAVVDAAPSAGSDQVSFVVDGTIRLTSGAIVVAATLAIEGPGADRLTLSGNGTSGILGTQPTTNLSVAGVTFADGSARGGGGAIDNNGGTVAVTDVVFRRNSAFAGGAIENHDGGTLTIRGTTFTATRRCRAVRSPTTAAP